MTTEGLPSHRLFKQFQERMVPGDLSGREVVRAGQRLHGPRKKQRQLTCRLCLTWVTSGGRSRTCGLRVMSVTSQVFINSLKRRNPTADSRGRRPIRSIHMFNMLPMLNTTVGLILGTPWGTRHGACVVALLWLSLL